MENTINYLKQEGSANEKVLEVLVVPIKNVKGSYSIYMFESGAEKGICGYDHETIVHTPRPTSNGYETFWMTEAQLKKDSLLLAMLNKMNGVEEKQDPYAGGIDTLLTQDPTTILGMDESRRMPIDKKK